MAALRQDTSSGWDSMPREISYRWLIEMPNLCGRSSSTWANSKFFGGPLRLCRFDEFQRAALRPRCSSIVQAISHPSEMVHLSRHEVTSAFTPRWKPRRWFRCESELREIPMGLKIPLTASTCKEASTRRVALSVRGLPV